MKTYSEAEINLKLEKFDNWFYVNHSIEKNYKFKNFSQSLAFIIQVGLLSEKANHHPEIFNVYNKVQIRLNTHDANGVTDKDFDLAVGIESLDV